MERRYREPTSRVAVSQRPREILLFPPPRARRTRRHETLRATSHRIRRAECRMSRRPMWPPNRRRRCPRPMERRHPLSRRNSSRRRLRSRRRPPQRARPCSLWKLTSRMERGRCPQTSLGSRQRSWTSTSFISTECRRRSRNAFRFLLPRPPRLLSRNRPRRGASLSTPLRDRVVSHERWCTYSSRRWRCCSSPAPLISRGGRRRLPVRRPDSSREALGSSTASQRVSRFSHRLRRALEARHQIVHFGFREPLIVRAECLVHRR